MIDLEHVSKEYKRGGPLALDDINLHVDDGEFVFLLGHSGAGKSTLLKLILREEVPSEGKVLGYGAYFLWVLRADPIMDHSAELFHDVSYAGGDRVQYRVVFYLVGIVTTAALTVLASRRHLLAGLGRHTLAIYLLHLPVQALLVELGLYDLMRGKATIVVVLWSVLLAAVTLAVLNLSPVQRACDAVANCWYKRK